MFRPSLKQISDTWVRRRLWLVQKSKILETVDISDLIAAAAQFNLTVNRTVDANGKELIVIPEDKRELKNLLRFLDDDYYTSPVSKNNYRTNSKVRL
ncbi:Kiwa anti-phage protein KwaB-like domain-containing protein [Xanthomonas oryzae]|uniref:Kiwa anti-phage protein KwaB-like domain-containing protein n=1 Tax=Xanthomonas oryzae TaxID=347 RepID=UPI001F082DD4|nr:Kiwa anti-phage protein KwaB-like domain-containing protein [Xanthomonas oryzae]